MDNDYDVTREFGDCNNGFYKLVECENINTNNYYSDKLCYKCKCSIYESEICKKCDPIKKIRNNGFIIETNEIKEIENNIKYYKTEYANFYNKNLIESLQLHKNVYDLINIYVQLYWDIYKYTLPHQTFQ